MVLTARDSPRYFPRMVRPLVCKNRGILDSFDQTCAKDRTRNAETQIILCRGCCKVRLANSATHRVVATGNDKQIMYAAVARSVRLVFKSRFPDRTVRMNEKRHKISARVFLGDRHLRIFGWILGRGWRRARAS